MESDERARDGDCSLVDEVIAAIADYCSDEKRSEKLREAIVVPMLSLVYGRFEWIFRAVQATAILLIIQFGFVIYIALKMRRR
jgi:hypothetical protein